MTASNTSPDPIKVGVVTDLTGPLSFMGIANANVAEMVVDDINATGGLLGRPLELFVEDSATDDRSPRPRPPSSSSRTRRRRDLRRHLQLHAAGHQGPGRGARARSSTSTPSSTRARSATRSSSAPARCPAQQVEPLVPVADGADGGEDVLPAVGRLHLAARPEPEGPRGRHGATAAAIVGEEYFPLDHTDYAATVERIIASGADVVFNTIVPPGLTPFLEQLLRLRLHEAGRADRVHVLRRELPQPRPGRARGGPVRLPRLLPGRQRSVQHGAGSSGTTSAIPGSAKFTAGSACTGMYRGLKLWEAAVDRGRLARPGRGHQGARRREDRRGTGRVRPRWCPASTTLRLNMYIAQAQRRHVQGRREPR